jgi:hypothetical protein
MKIELTNPQAQSYNPGDLHQPVSYQQFPTWITNYFAANNPTPIAPVADIVNVQYDALSLAYQPFLNDLDQLPDSPVTIPDDIQNTLSNYWNSGAASSIDAKTLGQIDIINKFTKPLGASVSQNTLGLIASGLVADPASGLLTVTEGSFQPTPLSTLSSVSSYQRDSVLSEQTLPDMYFFLTCRHGYKESTASFDNNRGYIFGINDVAFMRNNYTVASDTPMYIETGGDDTNIEFNDFMIDTDNVLYTYGSN